MIAIITVLITLSTMAVMRVVGNTRVKSTAALLVKLNGIIQQRLDNINRNDLSGAKFGVQTSLNMAATNNDKTLAEALARKQILKARFPQTWDEAHDAKLITDTEYSNIQLEISTLIAAGQTLENILRYESSEVLYHTLTKANVIGYEDATVDFSTQEVANTGGISRPEFIDAWGNVLRFYRWPTRLLRPNGVPNGLADPGQPSTFDSETAALLMQPLHPLTLRFDPDDPLHRLDSEPMPMQFEDTYHTIATYHVPLVVSCGKDELLGLIEPNHPTGRMARLVDPMDRSALYDNITNLTAH